MTMFCELWFLPVCDQTPMLHGSGYKVWDGNHVLFGQRIRDVEIVCEVVSDVGSNVKRVLGPVLLLGRGVHPELGLVDAGQLLLVSKVADNEASQVGHHGD